MKPKITIINLTIFFLAILFASCVLGAMSVNNDFLLVSLFVTTPILLLACLFFVNLGFALFQPKQRMAHLIMGLLIVTMLFWFLPLSVKWHMNTQQRWFLQKGIQIYQPMADKIAQNKAMITHNPTRLDDLVGRPNVYGNTNDDGSVTIEFWGRGNYSRAAYMYYSGNKITIMPGNTNFYCFPCYDGNTNDYYHLYHLTNGWYEY